MTCCYFAFNQTIRKNCGLLIDHTVKVFIGTTLAHTRLPRMPQNPYIGWSAVRSPGWHCRLSTTKLSTVNVVEIALKVNLPRCRFWGAVSSLFLVFISLKYI